MPIISSITTRRITQAEFKELAHEVMHHIFAIHNEFGRLFRERVYKHELVARMKGALLEVPVEVIYGSFRKQYFADTVVHNSGLFEFKTVEAIHSRHRMQCIRYLLLFDLPHGKIVNLRPELIQHEFVNCHQQIAGLRNPTIEDQEWDPTLPGAAVFRDAVIGLAHDWGTGLDLSLYEEAVTHLLGGESVVLASVPVRISGGLSIEQPMRNAAVDVAFKITAFPENNENFGVHARRLVQHTSLKALLWANIANRKITLTTIR